MPITTLTAPAVEPVSAADAVAQTHLRTEADVDADLVDVYLASARAFLETASRRRFVTQTLRLDLAAFPPCARHIEIPLPPLQSVTAVSYYDEDDVLQTLDPSAYYVTGAHAAPVATLAPMPGRVTLKDTESWPDTIARPDAVQVEFVAGYGDADAVPAGIKHAILIHAADSYAHRETLVVGTVSSTLSRTVQDLISPYWVP